MKLINNKKKKEVIKIVRLEKQSHKKFRIGFESDVFIHSFNQHF